MRKNLLQKAADSTTSLPQSAEITDEPEEPPSPTPPRESAQLPPEKKNWQRQLSESVRSGAALASQFPEDIEAATIDQVSKEYRVQIPRHYLNLIQEPGDPIWLQSVPDPVELEQDDAPEDPLAEDRDMPVPGLTHRYPDRVLFLVTAVCPMYCRYCTRKRKVGKGGSVTQETISAGIQYISTHPEIRDVVISGGDPLMLSDEKLADILGRLRAIPHLEIMRIGSRMPCVFPARITPSLCDTLKQFHPLFMNVHFNHPRELTPASIKALGMLADAGLPLGNQCVLLKGVNDDPQVMKELCQKLLRARVRPYYIYVCDITRGVNHFRTEIEKGFEIIRAIRGWTSGLAVPHLVIDAPGGGGKIPILPNYIEKLSDEEVVLRNYRGERFVYPQARPNNMHRSDTRQVSHDDLLFDAE